VPVVSLIQKGEKTDVFALLKNGAFWVLFFMMIMSGAAEQSMSQWASAFAEKGLSVSKTLGDLLGPCLFAFCMAVARTGYGKFSEKIRLETFMIYSGVLCVFSYLGASLFGVPWLALICCGICGFSVGIFWPGTYSVAAKTIPKGKTAMFALLAFAGDIGCMIGPTMVGLLSDAIDGSLKTGLLFGVIFPALLMFGVFIIIKTRNRNEKLQHL
ncbi:MAG: MFS transporter, partial [Clostridia bacterium]|nr:MFS transporter [Clostridia bacterium]